MNIVVHYFCVGEIQPLECYITYPFGDITGEYIKYSPILLHNHTMFFSVLIFCVVLSTDM